MKNVIKYFCLFLILLVSFVNVNALELCEMSDAYKKWLELSDEEKKGTIVPEYCKELYEESVSIPKIKSQKYSSDVNINTRINNIYKSSISDTRYSSLDLGYVTTPKDQMRTNSCWAFSAVSLVETSALKNGISALDLSERHIEYSITREAFTNGVKSDGINRVLDSGGNSYYPASYFFRHEGPILEESMPYQTYNTLIDINTLPKDKAILDVGEYQTAYYDDLVSCSSDQISLFKEQILKYGAIGTAIYYDESRLENNKYYYNNSGYSPNHAVTIIGWDDSISSSHFISNPGGNGAWIVKNSWGTSWGDQGYFYISYYDLRVCNNPSIFTDVKVNKYDNTYHSSETLGNYSFYNTYGNLFVASKFSKISNSSEYLDKVSIEFNKGNVYEIYVDTTNNLQNQSSWIKVGSGTATANGVKSFTFNPIKITGTYTVIVKYVSEMFPLMCKTTLEDDAHYYMNISSSKNYYSFGGSSWNDTSTITGTGYTGCEPVIYAYTTNETTVSPTFNIDSINGTSNPLYTFTDDYYIANISTSNIASYDLFKINILNSNKEDTTNLFTITNDIKNGKVIIKPNNDAVAGTYTLKITYSDIEKSVSFVLDALIGSNIYEIDGTYIYVKLGNLMELTKDKFLSNINPYNNSYVILDKDNKDITSTTSYVGTNMKIKVLDKEFIIVVIGDVSGDGKIKSNDPLLISRHLVTIIELNNTQIKAADVSGDGKLKSNDPLLISRFLVGIKNEL